MYILNINYSSIKNKVMHILKSIFYWKYNIYALVSIFIILAGVISD